MTVSQDDFVDIVLRNNYDITAILAEIKQTHPTYTVWSGQIETRIASYVKQGKLPLQTSGNSVSPGEVLKGTTTTYDSSGNILRQSVRTEVPKQNQLEQIENAIANFCEQIPSRPPRKKTPKISTEDEIVTYISSDLHFGAMMGVEYNHDRDWDLHIAKATTYAAIDYLVERSPATKECIVVDLGDLLEMDDYTNMTKRSGNILDVDGRWDKALEYAVDAMDYFIEKALTKHDVVYFYNIAGNHDDTSASSILQGIRKSFKNEPKVIVNQDRRNIKYHIFGKTALFFAHGHAMKMGASAESCAISDLRSMKVLDTITNIYGLFGHTHKDAVYDGANTKQESFRNLPPSNVWATEMGYRRQAGTMKSIVYHKEFGETSRFTFNVNMTEN